MATDISGFRFVRCPKCIRLLKEFADVPLYKCGGCGTILRAKNYIFAHGNGTSGSPENSLESASDSESLRNGITSSGKETIAHSLEVDNRVEKAEPVILDSYNPTAASNCHEKGEPLQHEESCTKEGSSEWHSAKLTLAFDHNPTGNMLESQLDENFEAKTLEFLNNENPQSLCRQGHESMKLSDGMEDYGDSTGPDVASDEDIADRASGDGHHNRLGSVNRDSHAYDGSVSSADDSSNDHAPHEDVLFSKGTHRHEKVLDSNDTRGKKAGEDDMGATKTTADVGAQSQTENYPTKSLNERYASGTVGQCDPNMDESYSKYKGHRRQETSLNSEDFHSVQNWLEPENDGSVRTFSRDQFLHEDSHRQQYGSTSAKLRSWEYEGKKILRKVDELKDDLNELFDKAMEGKGRSRFRSIRQENLTWNPYPNFCHPSRAYWPRVHVPQRRSFTQFPVLEQPPCSCLRCPHADCQICSHDGLCQDCPQYMPCHPPHVVNTSHPPRCQKAQAHEQELEKSQPHEKRQPLKRYCQPILGGAPFVICYNCLRLLQLPVDFFISRKRSYKLQCGACSEVLTFTFKARTCTVPQTPTEVRHPPSEVDPSSDVSRHEIPNSCSNDFAEGEPISFSEEYGLSFGISYSPEAEPPLYVSRNSSDMREGNGKRAKDSQLHRLLGYDSASELLHQRSEFDEECEITKQRGAHFHEFEERHVDGLKGKGICIPEHSANRTSSSFMKTREEDDLPKRLRSKRGGLPLPGLLKKGLGELNHGIGIMKLKVQPSGRMNLDR